MADFCECQCHDGQAVALESEPECSGCCLDNPPECSWCGRTTCPDRRKPEGCWYDGCPDDPHGE